MERIDALPAFRRFLAAVARLRPASIGNGERLAAFGRFLAAVASLKPASDDNARQLDALLKQAGPLVVGSARRQWEALRPKLAVLRRWRSHCDLLETAVSVEDSYTELIAWALRPATDPPSAAPRQRAWLTSLRIDWRNATPVEPRTQVWTEDGVPDLVLSFGTHTVVVEVKTGSAEHLVPSGADQTVAYPAAVRNMLGLGSGHPVYMVFLTPDGRAAANPKAICTSFAHFALVMATALEQVDLEGDLRLAFGMLITELATYRASPVKEALDWKEELADAELIDRIGKMSHAATLLSGGNYV